MPGLGGPLAGGALYTGRGPVCGTIILGPEAGAGGLAMGGDGGTAGLAAVGGVGADGAIGACAAGAATVEGCGGCAGAEGAAIAEDTARGGAAGGVTMRGGAGDAMGAADAGVAGFGLTGGAGLTSGAGGAAGRGGAAGGGGGCCLPIIAFSTSPGLEMCDKSILVLNSSESGRALRGVLPALWPSPAERKCARTFSASCSSSELEWVFFSVTPTAARESRIALLLTSSSLARSLIRILLIRLSVPPDPYR